jgi:hypothetical protein
MYRSSIENDLFGCFFRKRKSSILLIGFPAFDKIDLNPNDEKLEEVRQH